VTRLATALGGVTRLCLDTAPVVYLVEMHPRYSPLVLEILNHMARGRFRVVTSVVTLAEVLVQPFQRGDVRLEGLIGTSCSGAPVSTCCLSRMRWRRAPPSFALTIG
jgi:hypothetical protein